MLLWKDCPLQTPPQATRQPKICYTEIEREREYPDHPTPDHGTTGHCLTLLLSSVGSNLQPEQHHHVHH